MLTNVGFLIGGLAAFYLPLDTARNECYMLYASAQNHCQKTLTSEEQEWTSSHRGGDFGALKQAESDKQPTAVIQ